MRKTVAHQAAPVLIGVVRHTTAEEAIADIRACEAHRAGAIDLHLSFLSEEERTDEKLLQIMASTSLPILALNYAQLPGNRELICTEEERVDLMLRAIRAGAAGLDMPGYTFDKYSKTKTRTENPPKPYSFLIPGSKEIVVDPAVIDRQCDLVERVHAMGGEVLLSTHPGVPMTCSQVVDLALFLEERHPDILKIVTPCENEEQLIEAFRTMIVLKREVKTPVHFHCSGELARVTRLVNPLFGAHVVFCNDEFRPYSDPNQPHLLHTREALDAIAGMWQ